MDNKMSLFMTMFVRDGADIIRQNLDYHLSMGVDFIIVTDNGSVDGTREILAEYEKNGLALVIDEPVQDFACKRWNNRMISVARDEYKADWVLSVDIDEFYYTPSENLKTEILKYKDDYNVLSCKRFDCPLIKEVHDAGKSFVHYTIKDLKTPLGNKILNKTEGFISVQHGNHSVVMENPRITKEHDIVGYHYQIRSLENFVRKSIQGGKSYLINKETDERSGQHWRSWYKSYQAGNIEDIYKDLILWDEKIQKGMAEGIYVKDETILNYFERKLSRYV